MSVSRYRHNVCGRIANYAKYVMDTSSNLNCFNSHFIPVYSQTITDLAIFPKTSVAGLVAFSIGLENLGPYHVFKISGLYRMFNLNKVKLI